MSNRLRSWIIAVVCVVWAANFTAPIFVKDFTPAPELNVAFMAIIGILTASYKREDDGRKRIEDDGDQADDEESDLAMKVHRNQDGE